MIKVTVRFNATSITFTDVSDDTSVGELITQKGLKQTLGLPESYEVRSNGATLATNDYVENGDVLVFEKKAASKA